MSTVFAQTVPAPSPAEGYPLQEFTVEPRGMVDVADLPSPGPEEISSPRVIPFRVPDAELYRRLKEELKRGAPELQLAPAPPSLAPSLSPSVLRNFIGLQESESGFFEPPDTQLAAGPADLFELVNVEGRILTKTGTVLSTFGLNSFFGLSGSVFAFDPKVRFDPMSGRWFAVLISLNGPSCAASTSGQWNLAVSTSSDPTSSFFVYAIPGAANSFPDFPAIGINDDKVVLTANAFSCVPNCTANSFVGSEFIVINKANLTAGSPSPAAQFAAPDPTIFTVQPAHSLSSTSTLFMASASGSSLRIWSVSGVPGVGGGAAFTTVDRSITTLSLPPNAVQQGTSNLIKTNDNRLLDAVYRDGSLWVSANSGCIPSGDTVMRSCLRFIQVLTGSLTVNQDFDFGTAAGYYYYPAIQLDSADNLISLFSASSASEFSSVYASGRLASDPLNTLQVPLLIKVGEHSYLGSRWGDYSAAAIDPADQTLVWGAGEYASTWGTWIGELAAGAGPTPTPTPTPAPDTTAPTITITSPADGATYGLKQPVAANYSCTDPDDAVSTCSGPVANGSDIDTSSGTHNFTVTASDSHANTSTQSVNYTVPPPVGPLIVTPASINFRKQRVGTSSRPKIVKLKNPRTNSGDATITGIATGTSQFTVDSATTNCGPTLTRGKNCKVGIIFSPAVTGLQSDALTINDNGTNAPHQVGLSGVGK